MKISWKRLLAFVAVKILCQNLLNQRVSKPLFKAVSAGFLINRKSETVLSSLLLLVNVHIPVIENLCYHGYIEYGGDDERHQHVLVSSLLQGCEDARGMVKQ